MLIEPATPHDIDDLAALLMDAVDSGACIGFRDDLTPREAFSFWAAGLTGAQTWVARLAAGGTAVGVVQLHPAKLPSGAHRAEVVKLLVHRSARGAGLARALMLQAERRAKSEGRWLLQLDTEAGSPAERLYLHLGWQVAGVIPDHAVRPDGELVPTVFLFKRLELVDHQMTSSSP